MAPNNPLVPWGNDKTMNLNTLILTNIQSSPYFKVQLFELKTFHEVVDEIYYRVEHLEPWEKGSRKTAGQTGMCGGVRGVGAGGIVSSAYCLLFKLFTLKLTKKQLVNLITHRDSPYIRGLGFMYIRYCQAPADLWDWYEPYLDDEEELDVKAGGGHVMTVGEMLRQWLIKLEWYSTLFPRIPVPIQKDLDIKFRNRPVTYNNAEEDYEEPEHIPDEEVSFGEAERAAQSQRWGGGASNTSRGNYHNGYNRRSPPPGRSRSPRRSPPRRRTSPRASPPRGRDDFSRELEHEKERQRRERAKDHKHRSRSRSRERDRGGKSSRDRDRKRSRSASRDKRHSGSKDRDHREHSSSHHRDKESRKEEKRSKKHKHKAKERERDRKY